MEQMSDPLLTPTLLMFTESPPAAEATLLIIRYFSRNSNKAYHGVRVIEFSVLILVFVCCSRVFTNAALTGLRRRRERISINMPSLRD